MKFYRYEVRVYASYSLDMDGEMVPTKPILNMPDARLQLIEYQLHKETPKGYWIGYGPCDYLSGQKWDFRRQSRWVSKTSKKRLAYPTKEEALKSFIIRNKRRVQILEYKMNASIRGIEQAEKLLAENEQLLRSSV